MGYPFKHPNHMPTTHYSPGMKESSTYNTHTPPLTHYAQTNKTKHTYEYYDNLLDTLKRRLKTEKLQILQADKGPGLLLIHNTTLTDIYSEYLHTNATTVTTLHYNEALRKLRLVLYLKRIEIGPGAETDDRPPTLYFKIKTHKPSFITNTTSQPEIYTYTNGPKQFTPIARPIIITPCTRAC